MSSFHDLDPRLRDSSGTNLSASTAANPSISPAGQQQYPQIQDGSPQQNVYPNTPQSAGKANDGLDGLQDGLNDPKRPRACEACRGLKVRCEPDLVDPDGPCKRCKKANRQCVVTVPSRKRQKKTDSRVAELEKKIDALTASLHATKSGPGSVAENEIAVEQESMSSHTRHNPYQQVTNGGYGSQFTGGPEGRMSNEWSNYPRAPDFEMRKPSAPPMVVAGQKRKHTENRDYLAASPDTRSPSVARPPRKSLDAGSQQDSFSNSIAGYQAAKTPQTHEYADVVDRGLITADMATKMFNCYVEKMAFHMPGVVFPPGTTAADIRKSKPTLFLAILSASSGMNYPEFQRMLTKEVMSIYADRIICNGEKTLELIQALHISTLWYWPPEHFEELKFYQLIHIAAVMAIDIGMGKKSKPCKGKNAGLWRDHPWRRTPYPDPESIEARRAWLSCYFLCCNASMGLRRPNLIRWTPFMADCIEVLESSTEAAPSDKILCQWVRSQHIAEDIGTQFSMDDPVASVSIADPKVQYALKGFEIDLEKWSGQMPTDIQSPSLKMTEHVVNLYMHEVAMHVDHNVDEFKPPFTEDTFRNPQPDSLTPAHIGALSTCLAAIDGIFDTFLTFDVETIRCLPVLHFVRVAYAVVVLIKMYFAAAAPHSELGKVINKDDMKVELYLDGLVDIFKASSAEEKSRPSAKFLMVLIMLKTWFHRQREGKVPPPSGESSTMVTVPTTSRNEGETLAEATNDTTETKQRQGAQPRLNYSPANTPLQLLSEVATGNSGTQSRTDSASNYPGSSNEWSQQQQYPNYELPPNMAQGYANMGGNIDPSLGMDLGYTMGDGFEHAMGMTLGGVGDFGNYLSEDAFFGNIMDSVGGGAGFDGF